MAFKTLLYVSSEALEKNSENLRSDTFLGSILQSRREGDPPAILRGFREHIDRLGVQLNRTLDEARRLGIDILLNVNDESNRTHLVWDGKNLKIDGGNIWQVTSWKFSIQQTEHPFADMSEERHAFNTLKEIRYWEALWCLERYFNAQNFQSMAQKPWTMGKDVGEDFNAAFATLRYLADQASTRGATRKMVHDFWRHLQGMKTQFPDTEIEDFWKWVIHFPVGVNDWNMKAWRALEDYGEVWIPLKEKQPLPATKETLIAHM